MSDVFEKFNQLNLIVSPEDVFDYIGADLAKEDGFRSTYSCPYHADDSPSLLVDTRTGKFNCFACECGGNGGYACAKYYLQQTNNAKPTVMMVVNFLAEINPQVEQFKYLFAVRTTREYDYTQNKRNDFKNRIESKPHTAALAVKRKTMNGKQMAVYIDAIMTNMPEEFILQALGVKDDKNTTEGSEAFLTLLDDKI